VTGPSAGRTASAEETAVPGSRRRIALGIAYDGFGFHGFAAQPGQRTVAGELAAAIESLAGEAPAITCAGRTDSGVHASAQVAHVDLDVQPLARRLGLHEIPADGEIEGLAEALSAQLGPEVVVWRAVAAPAGFDARRSVVARRYRYQIDNGRRPDPLRRFASWYVAEPLDISVMRLAADPLIGEHDFAAFCRRPPDKPSGPIVRRVTDATWNERDDGGLAFEIEANAFCHQMVRSIVGALVAAGRRRIRPSNIVTLLSSGSRAGSPEPAPPRGLHLVSVRYPDDLTGTWS
jgi:tRNA pseudouridine38-40 synthase